MTREEFMNFNPAEDSVLAEKARVDEAMQRHYELDRKLSIPVALAVWSTVGAALWAAMCMLGTP